MNIPIGRLWIYVILISLVFCIPAFYNGFPLLYSDTSGYINSGFGNYLGTMRAWLYGGFLRHISLWESLWLVVFVQGIFVACIIYLMFKYFFKKKASQNYS